MRSVRAAENAISRLDVPPVGTLLLGERAAQPITKSFVMVIIAVNLVNCEDFGWR